LEKGADVNAQGGYYGNALQAAANGGHDSVVTLLLEKGADVNAQGVTMAMHFRQLPVEVMPLL
jgi:ankyrin repeat protein